VLCLCGRGDKDVERSPPRWGSDDHPHRPPAFANLRRRGPRRRSSPSSWPATPTGRPPRSCAGLPAAGADIIELGMPFSDPMADGPGRPGGHPCARSRPGMTLKKTLAMVRAFRQCGRDTPIVLMGYYNPIYIYRRRCLPRRRESAGVDGLIVVDLPPEEDDELCLPALKAGLSLHPPRDADHRRPAPAAVLAEHLGLCLLRLDHRHHRRRASARERRGGRGRDPHQGATPHCRWWWASASRRPTTICHGGGIGRRRRGRHRHLHAVSRSIKGKAGLDAVPATGRDSESGRQGCGPESESLAEPWRWRRAPTG
jgi:hypothetical protein